MWTTAGVTGMRDGGSRPAVAVLVDVDNIAGACPTLKTTITDAVSQVKFAAVGLGNITIARLYSSKPFRAEKKLLQLGFDVRISKQADLAMATDAAALLAHHPNVQAFVLASGDRDFLHVARTLLEARRYVVIVAAQRPSSYQLALSANLFVPLEDLVRGQALNMMLDGGRSLGIMRQPEDDPGARLRVFLCHSSTDKPAVRALYKRLRVDGFDPWLDEENLLPGQDWEHEITTAVRSSGAVIVCLSHGSITKEGFVQKEIRHALDAADEKPEGTIFIIPLRLEECDVPGRLRRWQWVDGFAEAGYTRLVTALRLRHKTLPVRF
jgi:hypothetical protein